MGSPMISSNKKKTLLPAEVRLFLQSLFKTYLLKELFTLMKDFIISETFMEEFFLEEEETKISKMRKPTRLPILTKLFNTSKISWKKLSCLIKKSKLNRSGPESCASLNKALAKTP